MTPHGILENMDTIKLRSGARFDQQFEPELWDSMGKMLKRAVHFDFGASAPLQQHVEFACDLLDRQMFRLPFPVVFYTSQAMPNTALLAGLAVDKRPDGAGFLTFNIASISPCVDRKSGEQWHIPIVSMTLRGEDWNNLSVNYVMTCRQMPHRRSDGLPYESIEDYESQGIKMVRFVVGASAMLMSKDVEIEAVPPPVRLNKKRAEKGRHPIGERRIIRIKPAARAAYKQAADDHREGRTPRMHWRRGHFRRVRDDLIVPVAPCIVNGNDEAKPIAKTYQLEPNT